MNREGDMSSFATKHGKRVCRGQGTKDNGSCYIDTEITVVSYG